LDNPSVLEPLFNCLLWVGSVQGTTVLVLVILLLFVLSFFVAGAEVAFFSLTFKDINVLKTRQNPAARRIVHLLNEPKTLLASLLIANSFINIGIIILSNFLIDSFFPPDAKSFWIEFPLKVLVVTFLLVLFAEVLPKVAATQNNIRFAYSSSWLVETIHILFRSLSRMMVGYADRIERRISSKTPTAYSLKELDHAIDLTADTDASIEERNILKGIVKFSNITVKQIMRTRMDVSGVNHDTRFDELIRQVEELHYSRLPVYKNSLDEIAGMVHTKDLLPYLNEAPDFNWRTLMRPPCFVHEQKLIEDLLQEFRAKRIHFAIVVDEFGGTSGIVTLEDIMEEIIGEIKDEFDDEESLDSKIDDKNYVFEGKTMINDMCKTMNLSPEIFDEVRGESDSLAGLVLEIAGEFPQVNEVIPNKDFDFTVLEIDKNRIQKVKVTIK
jgi:putative hemolysin